MRAKNVENKIMTISQDIRSNIGNDSLENTGQSDHININHHVLIVALEFKRSKCVILALSNTSLVFVIIKNISNNIFLNIFYLLLNLQNVNITFYIEQKNNKEGNRAHKRAIMKHFLI